MTAKPSLPRLVPLLATLLAAQPLSAQGGGSGRVSEQSLMAHVRFLADDALEGRAPGTRGERLAALYIASHFERLGLEPAGDSGTWFQRFTLLRYVPASTGSERFTPPNLRFGSDFVARPTRGDTLLDLTAEAVFAGYGISAPQRGHDDYAGIDVRGKVVLALPGSPLLIDSSRTLGTYYGEDRYKLDEAARRGAVGLLLVNRPGRTPDWDSVTRRYHQPAWIGLETIDSLRFSGMIVSTRIPALSRQVRAAEASSFRAAGVGPVRIGTRGRIESRIQAMNVVGCLPGQGAQRTEVVVLGGHYDHLGVGAPVSGDSIYNGALDNASGTATLLAAAEALAAAGSRPNRTICFVAFGAEERGLLGSQAYVAKATDRERIVAMLNIDGANLWGQTRDIAVLGTDQSSLGTLFQDAAGAEGLSVTVHPVEVRQRFYFRSDHLSFARAGIPSLFIRRGNQLVEGGVSMWEQRWQDYYGMPGGRYHQPSDHVLPWHSPVGAAQQARVMVRTAWEAANQPGRPEWVAESEFRDRRPRS